MTDRIKNLRHSIVTEKAHHSLRQPPDAAADARFAEALAAENLPPMARAARRLAFVLERETPVFLPEERIVFTRTVSTVPEIFTPAEWASIKETHAIHEQGKVCNISPNYGRTIAEGLNARRAEAEAGLANARTGDERLFLRAAIDTIDSVLALTARYATEARRQGLEEIAATLEKVPANGAAGFREALQSFRILHFALWASFNYHNTLGRLDQVLWPTLKADLASGALTEEAALELLEEFFLTFNKDSDLYPGMQQGDNGQSLVLGGVDAEGNDAYNPLSELCLKASLELAVIDPKINLRVDKNTPLERYELGSRLTSKALGFPQYNNDDVVIPGLVALGYDEKDARNYVVAACWEFIIPGVGMDIPNIGAMSFAKAAQRAVQDHLEESATFEDLMAAVEQNIRAAADAEIAGHNNLYIEPAPFLSVLMDGCLAAKRDISLGGKYNNYGLHGPGLSSATDALAAIRQLVYDEKSLAPQELLEALDADFEGWEDLRAALQYDTPKFGNNDDAADAIATRLLDTFADALSGKKNERGGLWRAGTGSAMYYVWDAKNLPATADGRRAGDYLSANYAPSLGVKNRGPLSIIQSFTKPRLGRAINGGPLTIEIHDSAFRGPESITKVAQLVKLFVGLGGHQLQLNALNKDTLLRAQRRPQEYRNLIVRVWGWSGYFVELDRVYQDHIIQRAELMV